MDSDDDDPSFVSLGTPLELLEEDELPPKKASLDLTVRDEEGRQRFHGAFSGGFSAGYFNTVGTKEGWAPSSFTSSRKSKAEQVQQKPEDFMDAEDLGEFGIAPRKIRTTANFEDLSSQKERKRSRPPTAEGPIPGDPPLKELVQPVRESVGVRLLQKLGWKQGQGVGPRVKVSEKKRPEVSAEQKVYGCVPPWKSSEDDDDPYAKAFTFAPDDIDSLPYTPKDDFHGIGYSGLDRTSVLTAPTDRSRPTTTTGLLQQKKKLMIRGQAFGVGALEEEDDDIYATEDMSQYNFLLPDISESNPESKKLDGPTSDMRSVVKILEGFHLASKAPPSKKVFPPPALPSGFRPVHRPPLKTDTKPHELRPKTEKAVFLDRHALSSDQRGQLLKEGKMDTRGSSEKVSVFTFLKQEDRQHLEAVRSASVARNKAQVVHSESPAVPINHTRGVFRPFASDPTKEKRYEQYMALHKAGTKDTFEQLQPSSMTEWEKQREREEFQRAAQLYRPLSTTLGSRFVSATSLENDTEVEVQVDQADPNTDKRKAAEMKMFGKLTREKFEWHPAPLLCKRFNVPNPYPDCSLVGLPKVKRDKFSIFNFLAVPSEGNRNLSSQIVIKAETEERSDDNIYHEMSSAVKDESKQDLAKSEGSVSTSRQQQGSEAETSLPQSGPEELASGDSRPPMDLFKAIFQDTSAEESSDEESQDDKTHLPSQPQKEPESVPDSNGVSYAPSALPQSSPLTKTRPATGIFANIDLDALNVKAASDDPPNEGQAETEGCPLTNLMGPSQTVLSPPILPSDVTYGPALPPAFATNITKPESPKLFLDEMPHSRSKEHLHKHKKKEKHKHHKHKKDKSKSQRHQHRHGSKKHERNSPSGVNSDVTDSDSGDPPNKEILKRFHMLHQQKKII